MMKRRYAFISILILSFLFLDILGIVFVNAVEEEYAKKSLSKMQVIKADVSENLQYVVQASNNDLEQLQEQVEALEGYVLSIEETYPERSLEMSEEIDNLYITIFQLQSAIRNHLNDVEDDLDDEIDDLEEEQERLKRRLILLEGGNFY